MKKGNSVLMTAALSGGKMYILRKEKHDSDIKMLFHGEYTVISQTRNENIKQRCF